MDEREPYYLVDLEERCEHASCGARATVEVRGPFSARFGRFCRPHGKALMRARNGEERAQRAMGAR